MNDKIKILLVDDEKDSREVMSNLLRNYFPDLTIVGEAANVATAYREIIDKQPDLVFLDIQMPRANGFSLLQQFEEVAFEVIFVTSFDQYAINAIKFNALDYLLKPVEIPDLQQAVERAIKIIDKKQNSSLQIVNLLQDIRDDATNRKIAVHAGDKVKFLSQSDILYIEADGRYCRIFMNNRAMYITAKYLKDFEAYFGESLFIRISKSHIINVSHITSYSKGDPCIIEMATGKLFETSRRKKQEVLDRLNSK